MKKLLLTKNDRDHHFMSWRLGVLAAAVTAVLGLLLFAGQSLPNAAAAEQPTNAVSESPSDQPVAAPVTPAKPVPTVEKASTEAPCMYCCRRCVRHRIRFNHCGCAGYCLP